MCPRPLRGAQGTLSARISGLFPGRAWCASPSQWALSAGGRSRGWAPQARLPQGCPSPRQLRRQSGTVLLLLKTSHCGRLVCLCLSRSVRRKVLLKAGLLCSQARTRNRDPGPCLVYLADVLPEQMGKGNDSLSHFCLHCTPAHPSFSHPLSLGQRGLQLPCSRKSLRRRAGEAGHRPPPFFPAQRVAVTGYANDETGSRLDKV